MLNASEVRVLQRCESAGTIVIPNKTLSGPYTLKGRQSFEAELHVHVKRHQHLNQPTWPNARNAGATNWLVMAV